MHHAIKPHVGALLPGIKTDVAPVIEIQIGVIAPLHPFLKVGVTGTGAESCCEDQSEEEIMDFMMHMRWVLRRGDLINQWRGITPVPKP